MNKLSKVDIHELDDDKIVNFWKLRIRERVFETIEFRLVIRLLSDKEFFADMIETLDDQCLSYATINKLACGI